MRKFIKRTIQDEIETMVSRSIIADEVKKKDVIEIIVNDKDELAIKKVKEQKQLKDNN